LGSIIDFKPDRDRPRKVIAPPDALAELAVSIIGERPLPVLCYQVFYIMPVTWKNSSFGPPMPGDLCTQLLQPYTKLGNGNADGEINNRKR